MIQKANILQWSESTKPRVKIFKRDINCKIIQYRRNKAEISNARNLKKDIDKDA